MILQRSCLVFGRCATEPTFERLGILVNCADTHCCIGDQSLEAVKGTGIDMQLGGNTSLQDEAMDRLKSQAARSGGLFDLLRVSKGSLEDGSHQ